MNRTSFFCILVRIEARSPGRSIAGPDVVLSWAPISFARTFARLVLPRPGPVQQHMVERLPAGLGRGDGDLQALLDLLLADILRQALGAQVLLNDPFGFARPARYDPI